jgi:hypothetical protein
MSVDEIISELRLNGENMSLFREMAREILGSKHSDRIDHTIKESLRQAKWVGMGWFDTPTYVQKRLEEVRDRL